MTNVKIKWGAVAAGVLVLVGGAGVAVATETDGRADIEDPAKAVPVIQTVARSQQAAFHLLAQKADESDVMSADAAEAATTSKFGRNPALARRIATEDGAGWVVPANGALCLVVPDGDVGYGTTCRPSESASEDGIPLFQVWAGKSPEIRVTMLVPDDTSVHAVDDAGESQSLRVDDDGVVSATVTGEQALVLDGPTGTTTHPLPRLPGR